MADTRVTYVTMLPHNNPDDLAEQGITHMGGNVWRLGTGQMIDSLNRGNDRFYTIVGGRVSWLGVEDGAHGKFIRARGPDGEFNQDLLTLPGFPLLLPAWKDLVGWS